MGHIANYATNVLLRHLLKIASYTPPTHIYIGLSTTVPNADGSNITEPSGNGYSRVQCDTWESDSDIQASNSNDVQFDPASGSWGTIVAAFAKDASSGGNYLGGGALLSSISITTGLAPRLPANTVKLKMTPTS